MSKKGEFKYTPPGETLRQFMLSDSFFRGIRGPVGSGKSVACCAEILHRAVQQKPGPDGKRRTRWAVVRNTNPQLRTTTIKTWLDWFPESIWGNFNWSVPYTHRIQVGELDIEVIFLALDRPEDVKKLLSLELTGAWINEAREVPKSIVDACTMRVGRFPSMKDGGPTWYGVWADTNAPEDDHWWPIMAGESPIPDYMTREETMTLIRPDDWAFFIQPPAMVEARDGEGNIRGYQLNPERENAPNVTIDYYKKIITGKSRGWIDVYVLNRLGHVEDGKPVYNQYIDERHTSKEDLRPNPQLPLYMGMDFGLTPAATIGQRLPTGRWMVLKEIVATDMGISRFAELVRVELNRLLPGHKEIKIYGDPAGDIRAQTDERTPFDILRAKGIIAHPAPSNDVALRIEAVEATLTRFIDGMPGLLLNPDCRVLRKGFRGGYHYKRMQVSGEARYDDKPNKNKFSHVHDALQYMMLGAGEGRALTVGKSSMKPTVVQRSFNVWERAGLKKSKRESV
ncbi:MAG: hypothetical protein AB7G80_09875, partial [Dongiaceae bacterium]